MAGKTERAKRKPRQRSQQDYGRDHAQTADRQEASGSVALRHKPAAKPRGNLSVSKANASQIRFVSVKFTTISWILQQRHNSPQGNQMLVEFRDKRLADFDARVLRGEEQHLHLLHGEQARCKAR